VNDSSNSLRTQLHGFSFLSVDKTYLNVRDDTTLLRFVTLFKVYAFFQPEVTYKFQTRTNSHIRQ